MSEAFWSARSRGIAPMTMAYSSRTRSSYHESFTDAMGRSWRAVIVVVDGGDCSCGCGGHVGRKLFEFDRLARC